ncbi:antirestriction protein [Luteococcus japonicus]|uniref:Antirestriction protein n=1 Tax=Luteococcus japonicus TaxID=33984 RepID=A0A3N1ZTB2_9ACTN|nr:antirestriction protein ArdA [Luteococcus japonicus]ROR54111.1 antirestriction protein [Luteococcus japonicus]
MTTRTNADTTPRAWIGCLHCHNSGRLVGEWFDAENADEVTLADVHGGAHRVRSGCEELWVMDHENIPVSGEVSPSEAAEWARVLLAVPEHQREALRAWVVSGSYVAEGTGELPSVSDFEERFCGTWGSFRDYAETLAEEIGVTPEDAPEELVRYFNWDAWTRDLEYDYTVVRADAISVFIFRDL